MSWPIVRLGDICRFEYGKSLPSTDRAVGEFEVFGSNGPVGTHTSGFTKGTTVIVGRKGSIGEAAFSERSCWPIDTTYYVDRASTEQNLRWLYYLITSLNLRRFNKATGVPSLNRADAYGCEIPLPPLSEQKRIAGILDQADALRRLRARALEKLNTLGQAVFQEMFGENISQESLVPLKKLTTKIGSGATPRGGDSAYKDEGTPLIRSMNVRHGYLNDKGLAFIDEEQAFALSNAVVKANDVLLNITGASVARVARAPLQMNGARVNQHVAIVRANSKILPEFLEAYLLMPNVQSDLLRIAESGATRQAITKAQIEAFNIPLLNMEDQQNFLRQKANIDKQKLLTERQLTKLEALFASLQSAAFQGKL